MVGSSPQPLSSTAPSSRASVDAGPLDPAATSSSGFKPGKGKGKGNANVPNSMPLEAWTLGCRLSQSSDKLEPAAWIIVERVPKKRTCILRVSRLAHETRGAELSIMLDRDVDQFEVGAHDCKYVIRHGLTVGHLVH